MTISLESVSVILLIIINAIGLYVIIKNIGAKDMETKKEIDALKDHVAELDKEVAVAKSCNAENDKAIAEMKIDIGWIKQGIAEIKGLLEKVAK
jgi:peptidoglycan hydrolase CwlO-like protein